MIIKNASCGLDMAKFYIRIILFTMVTLVFSEQGVGKYNEHNLLALGELLEYNVHFGPVSAGTATMSIDALTHTINGKSCYKINIQGMSNPPFSLMFKVNNTYGTYLDTNLLVPYRFYRNIQENEFILNEIVHFNHQKCIAIAEQWDNNNNKILSTKEFNVPNNVHDLVSSYYSLRRLDTTKLKKGQKISLNIFFDGKTYQDATVIFLGKQKLTTQLGTFSTLVFSPVLPEGTIFSGENAVEIFISDDANKIPLKLTIHLLLLPTPIEMVLKNYQGLNHQLKAIE